MQPYKNLNGNSNIAAFEIGSDYIKVEFNDRSLYLYNYVRPGTMHVESMKRLAIQGFGLNGYIGLNIKKNYYTQLR